MAGKAQGFEFQRLHGMGEALYEAVTREGEGIPCRIYIPAYRSINGGWFVAADTGGAIRSRHIDVYRPPPASPSDQGRYMTGQRAYVIPPH